MIELTQLLYFIAVSVALTLLPGPDILFVLSISISQGKKAGIATASGLCTGLLFHTTAAALGISALVYSSAIAFTIVKYAGAFYLIYLAFKALKETGTFFSSFEVKETDVPLLYKRGIVMNLLNPKVSLFFLAFLPQFVIAGSGSIPLQMIFLGIVFLVQALFIFFLVSIFAGFIGSRIMGIPNAGKYVNWAKAGIFSIIGVELALSGR
mgnify:FL=1